MTLNMLQATITIDGITEAEAAAYFRMAADMGLISQEAAQAAMDAYGNAIETINNYVLEDKEAKIIIDITEATKALDVIKNYGLPDKEQRVFVRTYGGPNVNIPVAQAIGGSVYPYESYLWQEPGREGELFIPSQYGRVMSQTELAQAIRDAFGRNGSQSGTQNVSNVVNSYYNLTMPTSNRPEEVMTAFELLKGYGEAL